MNRRRLPGAFIHMILMVSLASCEITEEVLPDKEPEPVLPTVKDKGERGLSVVGSTFTLPDEQELEESLLAGSNEGQIVIDWEKVDSSGILSFEQLDPVMEKCAEGNLPVTLVYNPISRNKVSIPHDLGGRDWSDTELRERFADLLYQVYYRYPTVDVNRVILGEEVDILLKENQIEWASYTDFFAYSREIIKSYYGSALVVGASTSFSGINLLETKDLALALHDEADIVSISYFPRNRDYTFRSVLHVTRDMEYLAAISGSKKVFFQECGYPSAVSCNSSEEMQRQFVAEVFRGWDLYDDAIQGIHFTWLKDKSNTEAVKILEESGMSESIYVSRFVDFLKSSGLQDNQSEKPAMQQLKLEAGARGW
ncbi:hypothetical protein AB9P05_17520 [Roseivirga sp. BDSF3-8]|uniref:hypothetical protein n=1 Tax=Roseivirga sp. BDSF3-8 TaxID=3241598 RepID=UPI003531F68E